MATLVARWSTAFAAGGTIVSDTVVVVDAPTASLTVTVNTSVSTPGVTRAV